MANTNNYPKGRAELREAMATGRSLFIYVGACGRTLRHHGCARLRPWPHLGARWR